MSFKPKAFWVTLLFALGLILVFVGQRVLSGVAPDGSKILTWAGVALVLLGTALRAWLAVAAIGKLRRVEQLLLICQVGALVALGLYALGTDAGADLLGISEAESRTRWHTVISVLWPIVMTIALLPLYMIELSIGAARFAPLPVGGHTAPGPSPASGPSVEDGPGQHHPATGPEGSRRAASSERHDDGLELHKVREFATSGLTIALAASFLMVTCNVAEQREVRKDVSYFKTSAPGAATIAMAKSLNEPLTAYLFFPEVSEVADEVAAYFSQLARVAGGKIVVERTDRMTSPTLAKDLKVSLDGTVVLKRGDKSEKLNVKPELKEARREDLRELDSKVQKTLMKVLRAKRVAYFSVGHGEMNDPGSSGPMVEANPLAKATLIKQLLTQLNYEFKDWGGFGKPVPDDASVLFVLAPTTGLLDEELREIDAFLARGGSLMLALAPGKPVNLGPLGGRLGLAYEATKVVNDKEFLPTRRNEADHAQMTTNQFSSHASVSMLSRVPAKYGILFLDSGHLTEVEFTAGVMEKPRRTHVVRTTANAFVDANGNFTFDEGEKRDRYNLVTAIEDEQAKPTKKVEGQPDDGMRAMVFASGMVFADGVLGHSALQLNGQLIVDGVRWLGGEEEFAGETVSEKDVAIEHTKGEDTKWFYATLVGAPLLVLGLGLGSLSLRRRRRQRRAS